MNKRQRKKEYKKKYGHNPPFSKSPIWHQNFVRTIDKLIFSVDRFAKAVRAITKQRG
jgi:hypothetical protein